MIAGTYVSPVRTPITAIEAVIGFRDGCKRRWGFVPKPETVAVLTAQSAGESARWASMWNRNPSNIKHENTREGLFTAIRLNELELRNGKLVYVWYDPILGELLSKNGPARYPDKPHTLGPGHPQCRMRAFATFAEGVLDKLAFLDKPRMTPAKAAVVAGKPDLYVHECKVQRYFSADEAAYMRMVVSLFKTYLPIARAQTAEPEQLPPEDEEQLCLDLAECHRFELPEWLRTKVAQIQALTAQQAYDDSAEERRREVLDAVLRVGDGVTDDES